MARDLVSFSANNVEVVDSKTLVDALLGNSFEYIERKNGGRLHEINLRHQHKAIRDKYFKKAEKAYGKIWKKCEVTAPGHNWHNLDVKGTTIRVCETCSLHFFEEVDEDTNKKARAMNVELVKILQAKMIEKDEEIGDLIWPV